MSVLNELKEAVHGLCTCANHLTVNEAKIFDYLNGNISDIKGHSYHRFKNEDYLKYLKPVVKVISEYDIGTEEFEFAKKIYQFALGTWFFELDGSFAKVFDTLMNHEGLTFEEAALIDNLNSQLRPSFGYNYQIGEAKKLEESNPDFLNTLLNGFFNFPVEKIDNIDSHNKEQRTYRYFTAFKYGLSGYLICAHTGFDVPHSVEFLLGMEEKLKNWADLFSDGKNYYAIMYSLTCNYILQLHRDCGEDMDKFKEKFIENGGNVVPYKFMVRAFSQDGFNDNKILKAADEIFFTNPKFVAEVFTKKSFIEFYEPLLADLFARAVNVHKFYDVVFIGIICSSNKQLLDNCIQLIYSNIAVYTTLLKKFLAENKLNSKVEELLKNTLTKLESMDMSADMKMLEDDEIFQVINEYERKFAGVSRNEHDDIRWYGASKFIKTFNNLLNSVLKREGKDGYKKFILQRVGKTISFNAFLTYYYSRVSHTEESKLAFEAIFSSEEALNDLFSNHTQETCNNDDIMAVLEDGVKNYKSDKIVIRALLESSYKKVINYCIDKIAENFEKFSPILDEEMKKYTKLNKEAEIAIKALKQRFDTTKSNRTFATINEVEEFAAGETLDFKNVFAKVNFKSFSPVLDKTRTKQISTKVLEVIYDKYFAMKEVYRLSLCDSMVKLMDRTTFVKFTEDVFDFWKSNNYDAKMKALAAPFVFYASNSRLLALKKQCVELCDVNRHTVAAYLIETMAMNGGKYALMLVENMGNKFPYPKSRQVAKDAMVKVAEKYKITVDKLGDLIIPTYDFNRDGLRKFSYGGVQYILAFKPDGEIRFLKDGKEIKALPSASGDNAANEKREISDLKKDIKTFFKLQSARFERDLLTGYARTFKDFKRCLCDSPLVRGMVSNLVWGKYNADGDLLLAFRYNLDGTFTDVDYNDVTFNDGDIIVLVHPTDLKKEDFTKWITYLSDNEMKQPITQIHQQPLFINKNLITLDAKTSFLDFSKFDCSLKTAMQIANRFNMERLPVCDGAGYSGYFLENIENDLGVEVCMDGLYIGCDYEEGENMNLCFFRPSDSKIDYWAHESSKFINPLTVPTRFMSTLLNTVVAAVPGDLGLDNEGAVVKTKFSVKLEDNDFDLDEEVTAKDELSAEEMAAIIAANEKPKEKEVKKEEKPEKAEKKTEERKTNAVKVDPTAVTGDKVRLEFVEGTSSKFWEIAVSGNSHTVTYGKIGTAGVSQAKTFGSDAEAKKDAEKLIGSKTAKGYKKV